MQRFSPYLDPLAQQADAMSYLVLDWVNTSSGSYDLPGLARMAAKIKDAFAVLGGTCEELALSPQAAIDSQGRHCALPLGKALRFRKRGQAPFQIFLGIHYDVVYGDDGDSTENARVRLEGDVLYACGGADAKGGLVIMLKALEAFEASPFSKHVGWEVLINPDEELGSPGSLPFLKEAAARNHLGLLFEPSLPDGNLVGARKGSGNYTAVVRGRASHAGRDPHLGRNAIHALAEFIVELDRFGSKHSGLTVNVGKVEGGGPVNRVPDLAIARFNVRARASEDQEAAEEFLRIQTARFAHREGFSLEIHGYFTSPPKPLDKDTLALLQAVEDTGKLLGLDLKWSPSGGVSDGNKLAAAGLPNVDTLGARGGNIHSPEEYLDLKSVPERARLTALLLMRLGSGDLVWPAPVTGLQSDIIGKGV